MPRARAIAISASDRPVMIGRLVIAAGLLPLALLLLLISP